MNFNPTDTSFGKNPGQLDVLDIPQPSQSPAFLAGVIQSIKDKLNEMTEEQVKAQQNLEDWRVKIEQLDTVDDFNTALEEIKVQPISVKSVFFQAATAKKYNFDKASSRFAI